MMADIEGEFLGMFKTILLAFAVIALVVASFSIHNTFSILIAQRSRESALLRALGASRRQVLSSVVVEAIVIGAIASARRASPSGYGLAVGLKAIMDSSGLDLGFDGVVMASRARSSIAIVVGVGSTLLASFLPALRASRVAPLAALRESAVDSTGTSKSRLDRRRSCQRARHRHGRAPPRRPTSALGQAGIGALADAGRCRDPRPGRRPTRRRACSASVPASSAARPAASPGATRCATRAAPRRAPRR